MASWEEEASWGESSGSESEYECTAPNDDGGEEEGAETVHLPPPFALVQLPDAAGGEAQPEPEPEPEPGSSRPPGIRSAKGRLRRGLRIVCAQCQKHKRGCDGELGGPRRHAHTRAPLTQLWSPPSPQHHFNPGGFPCIRCFDANLPCRPVLESARRRRRRRGRHEGVDGAAGSLTPLLDLALSRTDPLPQAEEFLQIFAECHRERPLHRGCALRLVYVRPPMGFDSVRLGSARSGSVEALRIDCSVPTRMHATGGCGAACPS